MAPDQGDGFDSDAVCALSTVHALFARVPKTLCLGDVQGTRTISCHDTSMPCKSFEARCCMQEERLEREAEGKRMLLEDQRAADGYNSHRNYQNLSARSPDTIEGVRRAAEPSLPKSGPLFASSFVLFC